jgi:tryptophan 2-monooxygenase
MAHLPNLFPGPAPAQLVDGVPAPPIVNFPYIDTPFDYGGFLSRAEAGGIGRVSANPPASVAIVGSGVAGLVAAYELVRAGLPGQRIRIFESSDRRGGRTYSESFGAPGTGAYKAEMGAMRFPPTEVGLFHYLNRFGIAWVENFPDPGVVPTMLGYKGQSIPWDDPNVAPKGFETVFATFRSFAGGDQDFTSPSGRSLKAPHTIQGWLRTGSTESLALAVQAWQEWIDEFENVSFYDGCVRVFGSGQYGPVWQMPEDFDKFAALGIGSGGFGPLYPLGFLEIVRLLIDGLEEQQQFVPSGIESLCDALWVELSGEGVTVETGTQVIGARPVNNPAGVTLRLQPASGAPREETVAYAILTQSHRAAQIDSRLAVPASVGQGVLTPDQYEGITAIHLTSSSKVFVLTQSKFWLENDLPQTIQTDTLVRGVYCLDYTPGRPGPGVVLLSYTWEDDSVKQLGLHDQEARVKRLVEDLAQTAPDFARFVVPMGGDYQANVRVIDWDIAQVYAGNVAEPVPGYYGAFKLNYPGHDIYSQELFFHYQVAGTPSDRRIYLAGESYSFTGGWIEGAIQTALNAASAVLKSSGGTLISPNPFDLSSKTYDYSNLNTAEATAPTAMAAAGSPQT